MVDLASLEPTQDGVAMQVMHPETNAPIDGMTITVLGMDSEQAIRTQRSQTNRRLKNGIQRFKLTAEELDTDGLELLVALTTGWKGFELDGKELKCTPENVRAIYTRLRWLREQVDNFVGDRSNFLLKSRPS